MTVPALDALIEPLTGALSRLTAPDTEVEAVRVVIDGAQVEIAGEADWLAIGLPPARTLPRANRPWDAQVALLMAMGYVSDDEPGSEDEFVCELELDEGESWDEQALREIALQVLGTLYYVYELRDVGRYRVELA